MLINIIILEAVSYTHLEFEYISGESLEEKYIFAMKRCDIEAVSYTHLVNLLFLK